MDYDFKDLIPSGGAGGKIRYRISDDAGSVIYPRVTLEYAEPLLQQGDRVGAKMMNQLAMKDTAGNPVTTLVSQHDFYDMVMEYTHQKVGNVHRLTSKLKAVERKNAQGGSLYPPSGRIRQVQFVATSGYIEGNTFVVDGKACTAKQQGGGSEMLDGFFVAGDLVGALLLDSSPQAKLVFRSGGKPSVPSIFGTGSDGDLYIGAGQTVTLPVPVPHQSVVEKNYKSVTIAAGGVLRCSAPNAGLLIRCKGSFTCYGTIDQSLMSPKTNPNNNYPYPAGLACGAGGSGGSSGTFPAIGAPGAGGAGMPARAYGGGYGGGGGGGIADRGGSYHGGGGGASNNTTIYADPIFVGGLGKQAAGSYGGGGGSYNNQPGGNFAGAAGANSVMNMAYATTGGAGNVGGGIVLLYIGGEAIVSGQILAHGGNGGNGGVGDIYRATGGGGGGGGGGGAVYILHNAGILNAAIMSVGGGVGGAAGSGINLNAVNGQAGGVGTVTVKKYVKGMT